MALAAHFINVGEGDAIYLQYDAPDGTPRHILVDGGSADAAERLNVYLQRQGATRLHLVVATHVDANHIGGLFSIFAAFPVARFWGPDPASLIPLRALVERAPALASRQSSAQNFRPSAVESLDIYDQLHAMALESGTLIEYPVSGYDASHIFPGLEFRVLGPTPPFNDPATLTTLAASAPDQAFEILDSSANNSSLVIRVGLNGQRVLLTGDAELPAWRTMIAQWGAGLHARVLKVSNHGANNGTNAAVLNVVRPRQVIISVGPNEYGHPAESVVELMQPPLELYRTDEHGDIIIRLEDAAPDSDTPESASARPATLWERLAQALVRGRA